MFPEVQRIFPKCITTTMWLLSPCLFPLFLSRRSKQSGLCFALAFPVRGVVRFCFCIAWFQLASLFNFHILIRLLRSCQRQLIRSSRSWARYIYLSGKDPLSCSPPGYLLTFKRIVWFPPGLAPLLRTKGVSLARARRLITLIFADLPKAKTLIQRQGDNNDEF